MHLDLKYFERHKDIAPLANISDCWTEHMSKDK